MQERFLVLGKAGSGKTHLVLQKFLHYVDEHKEDNVIFILPTHSQVGHLRDHILRASEYKGYLDTGLVTFSGLANRILDHVDSSPLWKPINESEKDLVLSSVLRVADTSYFSEVSGYAGFKSAFLDFIREIKENSLVPPAFKDVLKKIQTGKRHSPLNLKCNELVTLYDRYQQTLNKNSFVDKEDLLAQAQLHLNKNLFSKVELLLVDGFHDYTQLELKLLEELTSLVSNVYITLPHQTSGSVSPAFRVSNKTYSQLTVLGLKEMRLDENRRTNRQMLRHIEANIFSQSEETVTLETDSPDTPLQITAAANMQDEVEQIARRIRKLTYEEEYTFSQIAVIFRNIEKYQDLVEDTFTRFSIPVRIYGKNPLKENPLVKAVMNTISIFKNKWQDEEVWKVLKTNTGIEVSHINKLDQEYLIIGKIDDYKKWLKLTSDSELKPVSDFLKQLKGVFSKMEGRHAYSHFCDCIFEIVNMYYIPAFVPLKENHNVEIADLMKSDAMALREFFKILKDTTVGELTGGKGTIPFEEFLHTFESQVDLTSYKKTDRRKEVVNVIDVLEARQWEIPVVFVGGLLEKEFPRQVRENLFMKDYYRRRLNAAGKIVLREASEKIGEEMYLFYIAITRAKEKLYLSYPSANSNGNLTLPSFFLSDIQKLFSKEVRKKITIQRNLSNIIPELEEIFTSTDSKSFVNYHLNSPRVSERGQCERDVALWLYNNIEKDTSFREELCLQTALIDSYNNLNLKFYDKWIIKKIGETSRRFSPTKLKDYAQCPYKYFGSTTLNLRQAIPKSLDSRMQGSIIHKVLEEYFKDTKDIIKKFDDIFNKKTRGMIIGFEELKIRNEMLKTILAFESMENDSVSSVFRPSMFEVKFGDEEIETLKIGDGNKGVIEISGKIDRVDISETNGEKIGVIIDYKYGQTEFRLMDLEEGLDLQLPIYLLALREVFKVTPVAAKFYALKSSKKTGIYNHELINKLSFNIKPAKKSLSVDDKEFNKMLKEAEKHILKFSKEIRNGRIELAPANIDYCGEGNCDFANVCRIDKWRLR
tara:strand:- start:4191 stop:7319 length:3129 start_codon:yes stop_codon:yes gene_type:complete